MISFKQFISEAEITGYRRTNMGKPRGPFGGGDSAPEDDDEVDHAKEIKNLNDAISMGRKSGLPETPGTKMHKFISSLAVHQAALKKLS